MSERSFSIFFGRGSFEVRSSRARLASVSTMSPWRRIISRLSDPFSDYSVEPVR
jgi:hypothetical protein